MPHFEHFPFGPVAGPELTLALSDEVDVVVLSNYRGHEPERVKGLGEAVVTTFQSPKVPEEIIMQFPLLESNGQAKDTVMNLDISRALRDRGSTFGLLTKLRFVRQTKGHFGYSASRDVLEYWINAGNGMGDSYQLQKYSSFAPCKAPSQQSVPRQRTAEDADVQLFLADLPNYLPGFTVDESLRETSQEWTEPQTPEVTALIGLMGSLEYRA